MEIIKRPFRALIHRLIAGSPSRQTPRDRQITWMRHHFQNKPGVRLEWVDRVGSQRKAAPEGLTGMEIVAVLALWSVSLTMDDAIQSLVEMSRQHWFRRVKGEFYPSLLRAVSEFERMGRFKEASDLLKLGEVAANIHQDMDWAGSFRTEIEKKLLKNIVDLPFLRQRGW